MSSKYSSVNLNTLRLRQNGRHFADDIFKCIFLNENAWILIEISLKFVPKVQINNIQALVQIMAWRRPGDKPLSEPMMIVILPTHICVAWPQWVNTCWWSVTVVRFILYIFPCQYRWFRTWCQAVCGRPHLLPSLRVMILSWLEIFTLHYASICYGFSCGDGR